MFKFCTHCGAKMPQENAFCTQCGAKFPVNANKQTVSNAKVMDIALPQNTQAQKQNNYTANKMAQDEFVLGKEFMNVANPLHDYEKAIIHLKNAVNLGVKEAVVYIALSHLYLAADIIKNNPSVMLGNANVLNTVNSALGAQVAHTQGNIHGKNMGQTAQNNQQNSGNGTLQNIGKYAAAAAVGAVASSVLHSATVNAAENGGNHTGNITSDDLITPDLQTYADETLQEVPAYVPPVDEASEHIQPYNDTEENTETEEIVEEECSAADNIEPAEDDNSFFDSDDSDDSGSLFNDLFE